MHPAAQLITNADQALLNVHGAIFELKRQLIEALARNADLAAALAESRSQVERMREAQAGGE